MEPGKTIPVGIDLGTAYTRVAVFDGNSSRMIPDDYGESAMPSYVAFTDSGVLVGQAARMQAPHNPTNTIFDVIRLIGRCYSDLSVKNDMRLWPFKLIAGPNDRLQVEVRWKGKLWQFTPVEICSMILTQIKKNAERFIGATITDAVITIPVHFNYKQRQAIKDAGMIAGLNFMQIISSPAASALFYGIERMSKRTNRMANIPRSVFTSEPEEYNLIIFDLGAGTLDVAVATITGYVCKVRTAAGDAHLGGVDFDNNLVDYFVHSLKQRGGEDISCIPAALSNLRTLCEKEKMSLCSGNLRVPLKMAPLYNDVNFDSSIITEAKFLELNHDLLLKCIRIMETCFRDSRIGTDALHEIILTGSSTRIPLIKYYIQRCFSYKVRTIGPIEDSTVHGAACQALFLYSGKNCEAYYLSLFDATPFSLGVRSLHGTMLVCVPKSTNIPFKIEKTLRSSRRRYLLEVCEGEGSMIHQNDLLGTIELSAAHISADWRNIKVCFEMLRNGTLNLMADDISTGTRKAVTITDGNIEDSQKRVREALLYEGTKRNILKASNRLYVEPEEYTIGIDFGTTYSSTAVWQRNGVKVIENKYGSRLTCSAVAFTDTCRLIGDIAHNEQLTSNPTNIVPNIKRLIGRCYSDHSIQKLEKFLPFRVIRDDQNRSMVSVHYKNMEKLFAPEEIVAMILSKMKEIAEAHLNSKVSKAVISVPSSFNNSQRKAIKDAGVIAGFDMLQLLNETTAAAISYFLQQVSGQSFTEKTLLIFDMGGGNLDVSIVMIKGGIIAIQAIAGDTNLGGEDFDNNMVSHFVEKFMKEKRRDISNKPRSLRRLKAACEKAKRVLSDNVHAVVEVDALDEGIDFCSVITRTKFEALNEGLFKRSISCVERCLEDAMMDKSRIGEVVLVGGSTRIPKMQQLLQEFFNGKELCNSINADEAVVHGAAVQAAVLSRNKDIMKLSIFELQDVTSLSFGLENKFGPAMNLLIPKHTRIPAEKELIYTTCVDNQSRLLIHVKECEIASTTVFCISGIPPKPRGIPKIKLSFQVDNSGILHLTATDMSGRAENEIWISEGNDGLTMEEIQKMAEAEARYKAENEENEARATALYSLKNLANEVKAKAKNLRAPASYKKSIDRVTDKAIAWLDSNPYARIEDINDWEMRLLEESVSADALISLENLVYKIKEIAKHPGVSTTSKKSMEKAADDAIACLTNYDAAIDEINAWRMKLEVISNQIVYLGIDASSPSRKIPSKPLSSGYPTPPPPPPPPPPPKY